MPLKPQDLVVCLKLALQGAPERWTYPELARSLSLSDSEANAAAHRASDAGLLTRARGRGAKPRPVRDALLEFVEHGARFAFFACPGEVVRGMPTAYSAPPLSAVVQTGSNETLVWPDALGESRGQTIVPLYPTVPAAARRDPALHEVLALVDAIRVGRARERVLAVRELKQRLAGVDDR